MNIYDYIVLVFIVGFGVGFFGGYVCARLDFLYVYLRERHETGQGALPAGFFSAQPGTPARGPNPAASRGRIDIDTRTVVTEINTAGIQKGSSVEMGTTTAQADDINASVSRLSQLKGK